MQIELTLLEQFLPIIIPMLVALVTKYAPRLPKWTIPTVVLPLLAVGAQYVASLVQEGGEFSPIVGLLLGGVAILLREIQDQLRKMAGAMQHGDEVPRVGDKAPSTGPTLAKGLR